MPVAAKYRNKGKSLGKLEENAQAFEKFLDPRYRQDEPGEIPFFSSGARALIRVAGDTLFAAQRIAWNVNTKTEPIFTIDSNVAWDVDVGQIMINAVVEQFIDPTNSLEAQGLFHTVQSSIHQPYVEMQIIDSFGTTIFFTRGMFTGMSGDISSGQLGNLRATFTGVYYQNYVAQYFLPYSKIGSAIDGAVKAVRNLVPF